MTHEQREVTSSEKAEENKDTLIGSIHLAGINRTRLCDGVPVNTEGTEYSAEEGSHR